MSKQIELHILQFYQPKKLLGSGAYGHVWKVIDKKSKETLALKKIFDAFQNSTDAQRTYRQISLLHQMQHRNIVKLHKVIKASNKRDLYLVFEFMQSDLHSLVGQSILTPSHISFILFQILKALKYMHSAQLIHRDLKPSNILINSQCQIKICDFGLARSLAHEQQQENILSQEVATRWYRSPEMLLSSRDYSKPTDIWSVGCIVAELLIGQPIFPGNSTLNQLQKIVQFTGFPSKQNIDSLKSDTAQSIINNLTVRKKSIKEYFRKFGKQSSQLVNLTIKMLDFNPNKRPSVEQLLQNHIFSQFQQTVNEEEEICQKFITHEIDDNTKLTLQQYRKVIYKDIQRRYPQFNDATRIKSIYAVNKKHKSLMEKNKKRPIETDQPHNKSFMHKSLPKTAQCSVNISNNKKSLAKMESSAILLNNNEKKINSLKAKFYKTNQKNTKQINQQISQLKEIVKPHHFINNDMNRKVDEKPEKSPLKKESKTKQNTPMTNPMVQQQKAQVYKNELKKMKSTKNLIKTASFKPKFQKSAIKAK